MKGKLALSIGGTLVLGAVAVEVVARVMDLDRKQYNAIAVATERVQQRGPWQDGGALDVPYLPAGLEWDGSTLETAYGTCVEDHPGRTVLIYGDSTTVQSDIPTPDQAAGRSWPEFVEWPEDVQACGVAAEGFHPGDYAVIHAKVAPVLEPDLTVVLLCDNDFSPLSPRVAVPTDHGMLALVSPPEHTLIWTPMWQPHLYEVSEAFRFAHWRLALSTGETHELPVQVTDAAIRTEDALGELADAGDLLLVRLPPLGRDRAPDGGHVAGPEDAALRKALGVVDIELPEDTSPIRRASTDGVHVNEAGHVLIAEQIGVWIGDALDDRG
ncbi:MAG: SGNH/GDSL hydrolase family protein [Proteobacteria bacterium]|nr:SGNH/GDSL hydrolase family protein [Pseudomonadota bacterium]